MNPRSIEFLIQEAFVGVRRNGLMAVASISTIALSLAILASFCLFIFGAHRFAQNELNKFEIAVYIKTNTDKTAVASLAEQVRGIPDVRSVIVYPKEQAWPEFKKSLPHIDTAGLNNPLPDKLRVAVRDQRRTTKVADRIRQFEEVDAVQDGRTQRQYVLAITDFVKWFGIIASFALLTATIFIISNAIRLTVFVRRREIRIMQMVGATNWFIRIPLVIEGVIFGASGALIAFGLVGIGITYLSSVVARVMPMMQTVSTGVGRNEILAALMTGGVVIGAAGSFVSIRRFLKN
ncbi:MAG: permease-like cell division protein FtsX [Armatimonadota bacterium]|nr:permease-like cell division protein FtsX [Armatimonadota bacterium]